MMDLATSVAALAGCLEIAGGAGLVQGSVRGLVQGGAGAWSVNSYRDGGRSKNASAMTRLSWSTSAAVAHQPRPVPDSPAITGPPHNSASQRARTRQLECGVRSVSWKLGMLICPDLHFNRDSA